MFRGTTKRHPVYFGSPTRCDFHDEFPDGLILADAALWLWRSRIPAGGFDHLGLHDHFVYDGNLHVWLAGGCYGITSPVLALVIKYHSHRYDIWYDMIWLAWGKSLIESWSFQIPGWHYSQQAFFLGCVHPSPRAAVTTPETEDGSCRRDDFPTFFWLESMIFGVQPSVSRAVWSSKWLILLKRGCNHKNNWGEALTIANALEYEQAEREVLEEQTPEVRKQLHDAIQHVSKSEAGMEIGHLKL